MKRLKWAVLATLIVACLPAYAGEFRETLKTCQRQAKSGSAVAQAEMGLKYQTGEGVNQDVDNALYWFRKAAAQGNPTGLEEVGTAYYRGDGVAKDNLQAIYWWKQAAEKGKSSAMWWLGYIYSRENDQVTLDEKQACDWFRRSAEQGGDQWVNGDNPSYAELANCYERGEGIAKDNVKPSIGLKKHGNMLRKKTSRKLKNVCKGCGRQVSDRNGYQLYSSFQAKIPNRNYCNQPGKYRIQTVPLPYCLTVPVSFSLTGGRDWS